VRAHLIAAAVGITVVLMVSHQFALVPWWSAGAFVFQDAGQAPLLIVRCAVLFFALTVLERRAAATIAVVVLFLASLAVSGLFLLFVVIALGLVARVRAVDPAAALVLHGGVATALAIGTAALVHHPSPVPDARDPRAMEAYWRARKNPYQARAWALAWSRSERAAPGDAYLELATLDWELGRDVQARKVLEKVLDPRTPSLVKPRAAALRDAWEHERPSR
jgi:hypothetical protein